MDRWTSGAAYEQWMGRWSRLLAHKFLNWLALPERLRWIDICCGSGIVSEAIVELAGPATVVGVDASQEQIDFAIQHRAHPNVSFQVGDAANLAFPDASFDVAVCGLGLNFVPSPRRGLEEFSRVVCPGGTVAVYVWDYQQGARFIREFWDAATAVDSEAASFDQATRFPICTQTGLQNVFEQAGLKEIVIHPLEITTRFASFDDYWEPLMGGQGSAPNYLATRTSEIRTAIRERLRTTLPIDAHGGILLPARAWASRAKVPG